MSRRIFTQLGQVWVDNTDHPVFAISGERFYDITDALERLAEQFLGSENRPAVYTFHDERKGLLSVTGTANAIEAIAREIDTAAMIARQRDDALSQFNHLSEQLSQVAAELMITRNALGRAHDVIENKQRHIDMLGARAKAGTT